MEIVHINPIRTEVKELKFRIYIDFQEKYFELKGNGKTAVEKIVNVIWEGQGRKKKFTVFLQTKTRMIFTQEFAVWIDDKTPDVLYYFPIDMQNVSFY